ncbi:MAG TPA: D-alanyl-D-alanine carboxypeptidase/D-alanyl-D-alanine-endopeptidase [Pyrinomonadaceae bacterium]|jgi:D-alanyl-D-alanine carboxypeptidase/D-alanyl-D-alanine-endopeptidase (penicillin-binding protein 4)|nr:D-alanyl-D-alanine carboxypeptidase/D-alanyl-D-alanine-endopeptidase [Pyrinomonadaceae bacterium]
MIRLLNGFRSTLPPFAFRTVFKGRLQHLISLLLFIAVGCGATLTPLRAQQEQPHQRERRVNPPPPVTTTTGTPQTPTAAQTTTVTTAGAPRTIEELRARILEVLRRPELAPAQVAVKVASLDTGRTLFEENAGKLLVPASNMKLYTVAAALDRLSPEFRFKTSVYAVARPDAGGTVRGDLIIYGRGDPTFAASLNGGDYFKAINALAERIAATGLKRVEGDLVADETYFTGAPQGFGWEWSDLTWYSGAEVSALSVNDNALDLIVKPGSSLGAPCTITTGPPTPLVTIRNQTTTTARGTRRELSVYRGLGENVIEVGGSLPVDDPGWTAGVAVSRPALIFVYMLRASLAERGVNITGRSRNVDAHTRSAARAPLETTSLVEIAKVESEPLSMIAGQTLKPSQNLYTELILRALGKATATDAKLSSEEAGIETIRAFLREAGVDAGEAVFTDGSGLSRRDLVTASATLRLLTYMSRHRYANAFREALPIAGVEGTLKNRMKGTPAAGNVRAKTGTLSAVSSLSGYVTSAAGERLVFSIMLNNYPEGPIAHRQHIDDIAVLLASFAGKS